MLGRLGATRGNIGEGGIATPSVTLATHNAEYYPSPYRVVENDWGVGTLVRGVDFTESVKAYRKGPPFRIDFTWNWPLTDGSIRSYPFIEYQTGPAPFPIVSGLPSIKSVHSFDWSTTGRATVMFDVWLTRDSAGGTTAFEIQYWPATRGYAAALNQTFRNLAQPFRTLDCGVAGLIDAYLIHDTWDKIYLFPVTTQSNLFTNPTLTGEVAGTPGTAPTSTTLNVGNGITADVVGSATVTAADGTSVRRVRVRFHGTATASSNVNFQLNGSAFGYLIPSTLNQNIFYSMYLAIAAGSFTGINSCQLAINGYDGSGNYQDTTGTISFNSTLTATLQKFGMNYIPTPDVVQNLAPVFLLWFSSGAVIDITIDLALPAVSTDVDYQAKNQTVDWQGVFNNLITIGYITGNEFLTTIQMGSEVQDGVGSQSLHSFRVDYTPDISAQARLDPNKTSSLMTLSNGGKTVTLASSTGGGDALSFSIPRRSSGKWQFEFDIGTLGANWGVAVASYSMVTTGTANWIGMNDHKSAALWTDPAGAQVWEGGVQKANTGVVFSVGDHVAVRVDLDAKTIQVANVTTASGWSTAVSVPNLTGAPWVVAIDFGNVGDAATLNLTGPFSMSLDSGYAAWVS